MKLTINPATFLSLGNNPHGEEVGTVQADLGAGRLVTAQALRFKDGSVRVAGFIGRYQTSSKPWRATVIVRCDGKIYVHFGRDDRSGKFNKQNAIAWEPQTFATLTNPAYWLPA